MTRRCSHCSNNGHNSRTCPSRASAVCGGGVKLFGVRLTDGSIIKKSASMGNLSHYHSSSPTSSPNNPDSASADPLIDPIQVPDGYLSDDPSHAACSSSNRPNERKKGVPWTEEEHRMFLLGLQKMGKGDWRGISRNFVMSRTPTQVASHAQKYFIRQSNASRRKRRSSLFDMVPNMVSDPSLVPEEHFPLPESEKGETNKQNPMPSLDLTLKSEFEPMNTTFQHMANEPEEPARSPNQLVTIVPAFFQAYVPVSVPVWAPNTARHEGAEAFHEVLKPKPVHGKEPVNVDELGDMFQLSLREMENGHFEPSLLSLQLPGAPSRPSAFQANTAVSGPDVGTSKGNAIQAI